MKNPYLIGGTMGVGKTSVGQQLKVISLMVDEKSLRKRLTTDVEKGIRSVDDIGRGIERIPLYGRLCRAS